ncbi:MAG: hypothetical protein JSU04_09265 [Bdellovibrionales bacterium]|nr:hypothetical protein [Bdellovibrionales bacterium]
MEFILPLILIPFLTLSFAILTNLYREHRKSSFDLKPNCLLTRKPIVFLTGPRSIFYFRKYWNAYPEILAEHGYEVFTLPLPWRGEERLSRTKTYLTKQASQHRQYHFICDRYTAQELRELFDTSPAVASLTILEDHHEAPITKDPSKSLLLDFGYRMHSAFYRSQQLPVAADLGLHYPTSSLWLLQEMQKKGEQDFLS